MVVVDLSLLLLQELYVIAASAVSATRIDDNVLVNRVFIGSAIVGAIKVRKFSAIGGHIF